MAELKEKQIVLSNINGGQEYQNGEGVQPNLFNDCAEGVAYCNSQIQALILEPDNTDANNVGVAAVSFVDVVVNGNVHKKLKFSNLKGASGGVASVNGKTGVVVLNASDIGVETTDKGGAVGWDAQTVNGASVGQQAGSYAGGAVGAMAKTDNGGAVGAGALSGNGFAGGMEAKTMDSRTNSIDAIQLGTGTNSTPKTAQFYDYRIMNADGTIPSERLSNTIPIVTSADEGKFLRVNASGKWIAATVPSAEGASF